jgi:ketosteroid isomerase-like protein
MEIDAARVGVEAAHAAAGFWESMKGVEARFPEKEVREAFEEYVRRANGNDWNGWVDLFTEDVLYVDHQFGVLHSREEIRKWMVPLMEQQPEMRFIPSWCALQGDIAINYNWNRWPNPDGSHDPHDRIFQPAVRDDVYPYQFPAVTITRYAGNGRFDYEEDLYSMPGYIKTLEDWQSERTP